MERSELKTGQEAATESALPFQPPARLSARVRRLKTLMRMILSAETLLTFVLMLLVGFLLGLLFILNFNPGPATIWLFTLLEAIVLLYVYFKYVFAKRRRQLDDRAMSAWIERSNPGLKDRLITAVEFEGPERLASGAPLITLFDPKFIAAFYRETESTIRRMFLSKVLFRMQFLGLVLFLAFFVVAMQNSHHFSIYTFDDLWNIYVENHSTLLTGQRTEFYVEPGETTVARGADVEIVARSIQPGRRQGRPLEIFFRSSDIPWESARMISARNERYTFTFESLLQDLEYFVSDGREKSEAFQITVVERPQLSSLKMQLLLPPYTGLGIRVIDEEAGDLTALRGTQATLFARFNKEIANAELLLGEGDSGGDSQPSFSRRSMKESAGTWEGSFEIKQPGWYRIVATDSGGYSTGKELTYSVEIIEDRTPEIEIVQPTDWIDFLEVDRFPELKEGRYPKVEIEYKAVDDFGVAAVELRYKIAEENEEEGAESRERAQLLSEFGATEKEIDGEYSWDVRPLWNGPPVTYFLRVYDHLAMKQREEGKPVTNYSDSEMRMLFWGRPSQPPRQGSQRELARKEEDREDESEQQSEQEQLGEEFQSLSDEAAEIAREQEQINEEVEEQLQDERREEKASPQQIAAEQKSTADKVRDLREKLEQQSEELRRQAAQKQPPSATEEQRVEGAEEPPPPEEPEERQEKPPQDKKGRGGQPEEPPKQQNEGEETDFDAAQLAQALDDLAKQLEQQKIEQTEMGYRSTSGVEGNMRKNQLQISQGNLRQASETGKELQEALKRVQQALGALARQQKGGEQPGEEDEEKKDDLAEGSRLGETGTLGASLPREGEEDASGDGVARSIESVPFDEYQPSVWEPPPMKALGQRGGRAGEFSGFDTDDAPLGRAHGEERVPDKYRPLVDQYFQALSETE